MINPYGMVFDEITAGSLVKVDQQCHKLSDSPFPVNPAGFTILSAIRQVHDDAGCVLHTHTRAGIAGSCQTAGVLPISQQSTFVRRSPIMAAKVWPCGRTRSRARRPTWATENIWCCATTDC
jgi:ribulose-5-phosphate 4-epimerase/fuculose-1-phosphate aldolase